MQKLRHVGILLLGLRGIVVLPNRWHWRVHLPGTGHAEPAGDWGFVRSRKGHVRHPDHVALHRAVRSVVIKNRMDTCVLEYFVYINWRLAPGRDIRPLVSQDRMLSVDISAVAERKRKALDHYRSQNSIIYDWQDTPILTEESLQRRCAEPECFLVSETNEGLLDCFPSNRFQLLFAHYAERVGKRPKDRLTALLQLLNPWSRG